ncbi:hypothetical protein [Thalassobaculum sp.]|uniref:hypothetical protein n=1 Tax=Thalassobaculum sp. TaxID=2022740 RepID=UPI0032EA95D1
MNHADTLRTMIQTREIEIAALRHALALTERDGGVQTTHPSERVEKINTVPASDRAKRSRKLTAAQSRFLDLVREFGDQAANANLSARLKVTTAAVSLMANRLVEIGRLRREGCQKSRTYVVVDEPRAAPSAPVDQDNVERLRAHLTGLRAEGVEEMAVRGLCKPLGIGSAECGRALWPLIAEGVVTLDSKGARSTINIAGLAQ